MSSQSPSEEEIKYSYDVLGNLKTACDAIVGHPEKKMQLVADILPNLPDILEAFVNLIKEEHKGIVVGVIKAATSAFRQK